MDELRVAEKASRTEALRPLGLSGHLRQMTADQVALTGADNEIRALPPESSTSLNDAEGNELFIIGIHSPFSENTRLAW